MAMRPADGGAVELGEERLLLGQGIGLRGIRFGAESSPLEEARDPPGHPGDHPLDLGILGRREGMEAKSPVRPRRVDAVDQQWVEVDVQVEGVAEALHEGDRTALAADYPPLLERPPSQRGEDRPNEDAQYRTRERRVVSEPVAEREGQREHPLPDGGLWQHTVHQVSGRIGHAPAAA
jgi:hypothetical protein